MSIKTSKRIALGVIVSLVLAPFAAIAPANAAVATSAQLSLTVASGTPRSVNTNTPVVLTATSTLAATDTYAFRIQTPSGVFYEAAYNAAITVALNQSPAALTAIDDVDAGGLSSTFSIPASMLRTAGVYSVVVVATDANAGTDVDSQAEIDTIIGAGTFAEATFTVSDVPVLGNQPISVVSATLVAGALLNPGVTQTIDIGGEISSNSIKAGETVSFLVSLSKPTGSAVSLIDDNGAVGGAQTTNFVYQANSPANFDGGAAPQISTNGSRITLTSEADYGAFTSVDLGALEITPDVVGDYVFTIQSTDATGAATGVNQVITLSIVAATVNPAINNSSKYEIGTRGNNAPKVASAAGTAVCYVDTTSSALSSRVNYVEYVHSSITADDYTLAFRSPATTYAASGVSLRMTLSGPAIWDSGNARNAANNADVATGTLSNNLQTVNFTSVEADKIVNNGSLHFLVTGTGSVTIAITEIVTATGVTRSGGSLSLDAVTACTAGVYDADESGVRVQSNQIPLTEKPIADVAGASNVAASGTGYIAVFLADANATPLVDPAMLLSATSSAAVTLGWNGLGTLATANISGANAATAVLHVRAATAGTVLAAPIEIKLNGVVVATKTINFTGAASTIAISAKKVSVATGATTADAFKYAISDSAGTRIASSASVTAVDGTYVTAATAAAGSATAASGVSVTCSALRGKGSVTLTYATTKTEVVEVICAGGIASFEVTTNKSAYERGEIGVLTISAKDLAGNPVPDGTDLATAASKIQFTGTGATFAKGAAPVVFTDEFTDGKIDYAFTASTTAGSYSYALWHADLSPAVTKSAAFTVNAPVVAPSYTKPTLTASLEGGRVLLFGACETDEGDMVVYVKRPGGAWNEKAKTLECVAGEFEGTVRAPKNFPKYYRVKQEGTGLWSGSVLVRP